MTETTNSPGALERAIAWTVSVDATEARAYVDALRRNRRRLPAELAGHVYDNLAWKAAVSGFLSGLPNNPLAALPAAAGEALYLLRQQLQTAARVALLFDPHFFDTPDAGWQLLVPVLGTSALSQALKSAGVKAGTTATRRMIERKLRGEALRAFKRLVLKLFGSKITKRALLAKVVPLVGAVIGSAWNFGEVKLQKRRVIAYFSEEALALEVRRGE